MLIDRRTLLKSWQALAAAVAGLSAIPAGLFFAFGGRRKSTGAPETAEWIDLGPASEVGDGPWKARRIRRPIEDRWKKTVVDESVYLRKQGEAIEAVSALCTHTGNKIKMVRCQFSDIGKLTGLCGANHKHEVVFISPFADFLNHFFIEKLPAGMQ